MSISLSALNGFLFSLLCIHVEVEFRIYDYPQVSYISTKLNPLVVNRNCERFVADAVVVAVQFILCNTF